MCSKLNEPEAEICSFCGARLKPLVIETPSDDFPEDSRRDDLPTDDAPEDAIRRRTVEPDQPPAMAEDDDEAMSSDAPPSSRLPDWLDRISPYKRRDLPEEELEEKPAQEKPPEADWLERLRKVDSGIQIGETHIASTEDDAAESEDEEIVTSELPSWLQAVRDADAKAEASEETIVAPSDLPPAEAHVPAFEDELLGIDDLTPIKDLKESQVFSTEDVAADAEDEEIATAKFPDWLQGIRDADAKDEAFEDAVGAPSDLPAEEAPGPAFEDELLGIEDLTPIRDVKESHIASIEDSTKDADDGEIAKAKFPDWLQGIRDDDARIEESEEEGVTPSDLLAAEPQEPKAEEEALEDEIEDRESIRDVEETGGEEAPAEVSETEIESEERVRDHVPPLISDEEFAKRGPQDVDIESVEVPEWVADVRGLAAIGPGGETEDDDSISKATLPPWLEDMRPIESLRSWEDAKPSKPPSLETIGPLAGLHDVLMAEPAVAKPHMPGMPSTDINITAQQNEQISILRKLVEEERSEIGPRKIPKTRLPILQWVVSLVLVVGFIIPLVIKGSIFPAPRWIPQDLETLRNLIETLDSNRPALVVADYDPGYSAELEAVGNSLLDHLFRRDMPVITLSTRAPGPALAQRLIDHISAWHTVESGKDYLHLGYLAGGPTAVQLFASNPRRESLRGFMLPKDRDWISPWQSPILEDVQQLADFSVVVVITAGTETARTWAEQAAPLTGDTPFIMVLSAGAEPLVRPYYAGPDAHVDAILTGMPSAKANEILNGKTGDASLLWDSFSLGGWIATCFLIAGGVIGTTLTILRRGGKDEGHV
jgi:hypothetical protein